MIYRCTARLLVLLVLVAGLPRPAAAQTIADPELFEKSVHAASQAVEQYGRYDDPEAEARVNRIGYELAQHSEFQKFPFTFALVDVPVPNAFALPGGQIFVTRGMLDLGLNDDMLANLLGHEIGHVTLEHFRRMQRKATLLTVLGNVLLAGVLIGASESGGGRSGPQAPYDPRVGYDSGNGDLVQGAAAASLILSELLLRSYSREHEDESDEEGQRLSAAAGYDPDGARQLWELMNQRAPQAREYGYWQTHPFQVERERAAEARKGTWKPQTRKPVDDYRQRTQAVLLNYLDKKPAPKTPPPSAAPNPPRPGEPARRPAGPMPGDEISFLKAAALTAWPQGKGSDNLRLERLQALRDQELTRPLLSRDYGQVMRAYRAERDAVRALTPDSALLKSLETELADFDVKLKELYPRAVELFGGGVYETSFLESFRSNFPQAPENPRVALALGDAYSRLGNQTDAVEQYLDALEAAPASAEGKRALAGLRNLAPSLQELAALQQLADQGKDPELQKIAAERLATMVKTYADVTNGAEYLRRFPEGAHVAQVIDRLNVLADNLYGEVVLYQGVGDSLKAMERINKILTHAPLSPAAEKLRDRAVIQEDRRG
jgi:Zn-dependent protease with chaperone function